MMQAIRNISNSINNTIDNLVRTIISVIDFVLAVFALIFSVLIVIAVIAIVTSLMFDNVYLICEQGNFFMQQLNNVVNFITGNNPICWITI